MARNLQLVSTLLMNVLYSYGLMLIHAYYIEIYENNHSLRLFTYRVCIAMSEVTDAWFLNIPSREEHYNTLDEPETSLQQSVFVVRS